MRQWLLITEDDFYNWSQCYEWTLPSKPFSRTSKVKTVLRELYTRFPERFSLNEEELLTVEFETLEKRVKRGLTVPFYAIKRICGLTDERNLILRDRYGALGLVVSPMEQKRILLCKNVVCEFNQMRESCDSELGARALFELTGQQWNPNCDSRVRTILGAIRQEDRMLSCLFGYSRGEPWPCDGLLAGLCDLGKILRNRQDFVYQTELQLLAARTKDALIAKRASSFALVRELIGELNENPDFNPAYVFFFNWKYAAERKGGQLDLDCMMHDIKEAGTGNWQTIHEALCLFGVFSGFKSFADVYHFRMRQMTALKVNVSVSTGKDGDL